MQKFPSSSSVPESSMSGSSSVSLGLDHKTPGIKHGGGGVVPRQGFFKLAKNRRFVTMIEIFDRSEEYDLEAWLFPGADSSVPTGSISATPPAPPESPKPSTPSSSSSRKLRSPFRSPLTPSKRDDEYNLHLFRGETPLHVLLRYNPTEELVSSLIEYLSSHSERSLGVPEDAVDMLGRTPLHVACANGCSVAVVGRLITGVSAAMPAFAKDVTGRHALHWACANPHGEPESSSLESNNNNNSNSNNKSFTLGRKKNKFVESMAMVDNMVNVIKVLLKAYPESVLIADRDGNRPKDLARIHKADERILLMLSREERDCEFDHQIQPNFASVTDMTVARDHALPKRDDVSSIGSCGLSCSNNDDDNDDDDDETDNMNKPPKNASTTNELWETSPFRHMTKSEEVIRFVEKTVMLRPPLVFEEFDLFGNEITE